MSLYLTSFFIFHLFSISAIDLRWGNLLFIPVHAWQMYEHVIYMMNSPFEGWHMVISLAWWNKSFYYCSNSTIEISWVMTIISPVSPEFKMLQEGCRTWATSRRSSTLECMGGYIYGKYGETRYSLSLINEKWCGSRHIVFWSLGTLAGLRDRARGLVA